MDTQKYIIQNIEKMINTIKESDKKLGDALEKEMCKCFPQKT